MRAPSDDTCCTASSVTPSHQWRNTADTLDSNYLQNMQQITSLWFPQLKHTVTSCSTFICYLCEELSDVWQWDLAYESRAWIEDESHWNEYDQMDVWMRGRNVKNSRELLGLEPVSLRIKSRRWRWFEHVEQKDDNDWVKRCIIWEVEGIRQRGHPRKRPDGIVLRMTWKV